MRSIPIPEAGNSRIAHSPGNYQINRLPGKVLLQFTRDLGIMLNAGMQLVESIRILAEQHSHQRLRELLAEITNRLNSGAAFHETLRNHPQIFSEFYCQLVAVGEMTGKLAEMLERVAAYLEKIADLKRKLVQAMTYPALVIAVALTALIFIMQFVIPAFAEIFADFDAPLPFPTRIIIAISNWVGEYLWGFPVALLLMFLLYRRAWKNDKLRYFFEGLLLLIPFIGGLIRKNHIARFCRTLGTLLESRIPLLGALDIARQAAGNHLVAADIRLMHSSAQKGGNLAAALQHSKIFPMMVIRMIAVGEETAELPAMFLRIADYYEKEIDSSIETLASVIEPVMIVILGGIIGVILISIYLPLFNLSTVMF